MSHRMPQWLRAPIVFAIVAVASACGPSGASHANADEPANKATLTMVVMDPLAKELSCPCVKGYAQRDYERLAKYLESKLEQPVALAFSDSLPVAIKERTAGKADIIIGKRSVVLADAKRVERGVVSVAKLTGKDGSTTQRGLIVVPTKDSAKSVKDLADYLIVFGPSECDEKYEAAKLLLTKNGVSIPSKLETAGGCDEGATRILELPDGQHGAAVISSYAKPLLEGCGTVPKGALRVVGETEPVPFIEAFVSTELPNNVRDAIKQHLGSVKQEPGLCRALESREGFVVFAEPLAQVDSKKASSVEFVGEFWFGKVAQIVE